LSSSFSILARRSLEALEATQERLKEIEDEQITLGERLARIEKDDDNAVFL